MVSCITTSIYWPSINSVFSCTGDIIMKICKRNEKWKSFSDYIYKTVAWSDDELPYCPICGMCSYDSDYSKTHDYFKLNEGIEKYEF